MENLDIFLICAIVVLCALAAWSERNMVKKQTQQQENRVIAKQIEMLKRLRVEITSGSMPASYYLEKKIKELAGQIR